MSARTFVCTIASPEEVKPFEFFEDPKNGTFLRYYVKARPSDTPFEIVRSIYDIRSDVYQVAIVDVADGLNLKDEESAKSSIRSSLLGEKKSFQSEDETFLTDQEYVNLVLCNTEPILTDHEVYNVAGFKRGEEDLYFKEEEIEAERLIIERYNLYIRQVLHELIKEGVLNARFEFVDQTAMTPNME